MKSDVHYFKAMVANYRQRNYIIVYIVVCVCVKVCGTRITNCAVKCVMYILIYFVMVYTLLLSHVLELLNHFQFIITSF